MTPLPAPLWPLLLQIAPTTAAKEALQALQRRGMTLNAQQAQALLDTERHSYLEQFLWPLLDDEARAHFAAHSMKASHERAALEAHWDAVFADLRELRAANPVAGAERTRELYTQLWTSDNFTEKHTISPKIVGLLWENTLPEDYALIYSDFPNKYLKALRGRFAGPLQVEWLTLLKEAITYKRKRWQFGKLAISESMLDHFFLGEMGSLLLCVLTLPVLLQTLGATAEDLLADAQKSKQPLAQIVQNFLESELKKERTWQFSSEEIANVPLSDLKVYALTIPSQQVPLLIERILDLIQQDNRHSELYWLLSVLAPKLELDASIKEPLPIPFVIPEPPKKHWRESTVGRWQKAQALQHVRNQNVAVKEWHTLMDTLRLRREWAQELEAAK